MNHKLPDDSGPEMRHVLLFHDPTRWAAVPANNGANGPAWQWGDELLAGFTVGTHARAEKGHQCSYNHPFESWLARSTDGGDSWNAWVPQCYAGQPAATRARGEPANFSDPGFVLRVEGSGYHGNTGRHWYSSTDRGANWQGPFGFGSLLDHAELTDMEFTSRTAYLVGGTQELLLFLSARKAANAGGLKNAIPDKAFLAETIDGGRSFQFVTWLLPWSDPYRAMMAAPARLSSTHIVAALRRKSASHNWIDCVLSGDNGKSWSHLSRVAGTETANSFNGNPPALMAIADGRLCCVYGNRTERRILARFSADGGATWDEPLVLRDDFHSANGWPDLGYPRLYQRGDERLVAVYFWCTADMPETHIEATIFSAT